MKLPSKSLALLTGAVFFSASSLIVGTASAESVTTDPVGYVTVDLPANSETFVSVPLVEAPQGAGSLSDIPVTNGSESAILASDNGDWEVDQFASTHFIRFTSGDRGGRWYPIMSNGATSLEIDLNGDDLEGVQAGDTFKIFKFWTLASLFPEGSPAIHQSTGNLGFQRGTEVLFPDMLSEGKNLAPSRIFFQKSTGWVEAVSGFPVADDQVVLPNSFIIIKHPATSTSTKLVMAGSVDTQDTAIQLNTSDSGDQDNFVSVTRPVQMSLGQLGLLSSNAFVQSEGNLGFQRKDELLLFNNSEVATKKSPSRIFFAVDGQWREAVSGFPNVTDQLILNPGDSFIIRKKNTENGETVFWNNSPTY